MITTYKRGNLKEGCLEPGYYRVFGRKKIRKLYIDGAKYHNMNCIRSDDGNGRSTNIIMFNEDEYNKLKNRYVARRKEQEKKEGENKLKIKFEMLKYKISTLSKSCNVQQKDIAKHLGVHDSVLCKWKVAYSIHNEDE